MSKEPLNAALLDGKKFIGIGKIVFETPGFPWNIPHTHFIVNKTPSGLFEATNLSLSLIQPAKQLMRPLKLWPGLRLPMSWIATG